MLYTKRRHMGSYVLESKWERVGFSGMRSNCGNPPPEWPPQPNKNPDNHAHTGLVICLARQLKTYSLEYTSVKQEKSVALRIIHSIVATAAFSSNPKTHQAADLVTLIFYF